jgi:uncharacterized membrane protein (DUF373 family)
MRAILTSIAPMRNPQSDLFADRSTARSTHVVIDAVYPALLRFLTGALIAVFCVWLAAGGYNMAVAAGEAFGGNWGKGAEQAVLSGLLLLALLEVIRTLQAYLALGRVRVTFIIDTALVMLIGELMGLWFREYAPQKVLLALAVIITLAALRILTARYSPDDLH